MDENCGDIFEKVRIVCIEYNKFDTLLDYRLERNKIDSWVVTTDNFYGCIKIILSKLHSNFSLSHPFSRRSKFWISKTPLPPLFFYWSFHFLTLLGGTDMSRPVWVVRTSPVGGGGYRQHPWRPSGGAVCTPPACTGGVRIPIWDMSVTTPRPKTKRNRPNPTKHVRDTTNITRMKEEYEW